MTTTLDHILWAAPDLDAGTEIFAALSGVIPVTGGTHPGFGTRNRLASLGGGVFFEIIAPDPAQSPLAGRGASIAAMPGPGLIAFAIQTTDADAACTAAAAAGLAVAPRVPMHRTRPDGVRLDWSVLHFSHPFYGALIPFAIDWQGSPHPSTTTPEGCHLRSLTVLHPDPLPLAAIYKAMGIDIPVMGGANPGLVAILGTPKGAICLLGAV